MAREPSDDGSWLGDWPDHLVCYSMTTTIYIEAKPMNPKHSIIKAAVALASKRPATTFGLFTGMVLYVAMLVTYY